MKLGYEDDEQIQRRQPLSGNSWFASVARRFLLDDEETIRKYTSFAQYSHKLTLSYLQSIFLIAIPVAILGAVFGIIQFYPHDMERLVSFLILQAWVLAYVGSGLYFCSGKLEEDTLNIQWLMIHTWVGYVGTYAMVARIGPLNEPWSYTILMSGFLTVFFVIPMGTRVVFVLFVIASVAAGTVFMNPENVHFEHLGLYLSFMGVLCIWVILLGSLHEQIVRGNYFYMWKLIDAEDALERQKAEALSYAEQKADEAATAVFEKQFAQQAERRRIANDLHDELGHRVVSLKLDLENFAETTSGEGIQSRTTGFLSKLTEIDHGVHRVIQAMRDSSLPRGVLGPMIEATLGRILTGTDVKYVALVEPEDLVVTDRVYATIFRILQESLNNTLKHAKAEQVEVAVLYAEGMLTFTYHDDGEGFDTSNYVPGFGLSGMRERALALGGEYRFESALEEGVTLTVTIPMEVMS